MLRCHGGGESSGWLNPGGCLAALTRPEDLQGKLGLMILMSARYEPPRISQNKNTRLQVLEFLWNFPVEHVDVSLQARLIIQIDHD